MPVPQVKPCPFCKFPDGQRIQFYQSASPKEFIVCCRTCGGGARDRLDPQAAVDKWNRRTQDFWMPSLPLDAAMFLEFNKRNVPDSWKETDDA
jgi:hypothetical protein